MFRWDRRRSSGSSCRQNRALWEAPGCWLSLLGEGRSGSRLLVSNLSRFSFRGAELYISCSTLASMLWFVITIKKVAWKDWERDFRWARLIVSLWRLLRLLGGSSLYSYSLFSHFPPFQIDVGEAEPRTVVSGLVKHVPLDQVSDFSNLFFSYFTVFTLSFTVSDLWSTKKQCDVSRGTYCSDDCMSY